MFAVATDDTGYELTHPGSHGLPDDLSRGEARAAFRRVMETKESRIAELRRLLSNFDVSLASDDASIQALNDWFVANIKADPKRPGFLRPEWSSIAYDVGLFLGEVIIARHPNLHWELFTWGKTDVAFHRAVIMGMSTEDVKLRTYIDILDMTEGYAHFIVEAHGSVPKYGVVEVRGAKIDVDVSAERARASGVDRRRFVSWLERAAERA